MDAISRGALEGSLVEAVSLCTWPGEDSSANGERRVAATGSSGFGGLLRATRISSMLWKRRVVGISTDFMIVSSTAGLISALIRRGGGIESWLTTLCTLSGGTLPVKRWYNVAPKA
jgi:hypothetical protein